MIKNKSQEETERESFTEIKSEIKRQYESILNTDDSHDTKTGILLGFIVLFLAQTITNETIFKLSVENRIYSIFFIMGYIFILISGYYGMKAFNLRKQHRGGSLFEILNQYKTGEKRDYEKVISGAIFKAYQLNTQLIEQKSQIIKKMFIVLSMGLIFFIIPGLIKMMNIWCK